MTAPDKMKSVDGRKWIGVHSKCGGDVFDCQDGTTWWTECEKCRADTRRGKVILIEQRGGDE